LIISKTPLRISFFGGGTDYPDYINKFGQGAVLGTTINKYIYFSTSKFYSQLFNYSIRISYRKVECVNSLDEIEHVPFRECLRLHNINSDIEVDYTAELPAYTGMGSSSSFVVGLLNSLYAFKGKTIDPLELAKEAIKVERDILHEPVGYQDQTFAAVGGFNIINFNSAEDILVEPISLDKKKHKQFEDYLMLFFTGIKRKSNNIIKKQIMKINDNESSLRKMRQMVDKGYDILTNSKNFEEFGALLDKSWKIKRSLDQNISNDTIDEIYEQGMKAGSIGGKLLGAGGGGFILLFVHPNNKQEVRKRLKKLTETPIKISSQGSTILPYN